MTESSSQTSKSWNDVKTILKRERLMVVSTLIAITIAFLVMGIVLGIFVVTQTGIKQLEEQAQVTIFFKDDFPKQNVLDLQKKLLDDPRVLDVVFVSKEDAFKIFSEINKNEPVLLESITPSILPASLEIRATKLIDLSDLAKEFELIDGVEDIKFFKDVIEKFRLWSNVFYIVGSIFVLIFLTISYSIIIATLRTAINAKGQELEILKLVGASDSYVKRPFVALGVFFGVTATSAASVLLIFLYLLVVERLLGFSQITILGLLPYKVDTLLFSLVVGVVFIFLGGLFGYIGSTTAVKKYLDY